MSNQRKSDRAGADTTPHRLPRYQRLYYSSFMFEIKAQPSSDRVLALTALALVAATGNVSMSFEELRAAIVLLTHHSDLNLTKARLLECTKGLLKISDVVTTFHGSAATFIAEECEEYLADYHVDMNRLVVRAVVRFRQDSPRKPMGVAQHLRTPLQLLRDHPFVAYSMEHWPTFLCSTASHDAMQPLLSFLDEYDQDTSIQQAMFLTMNRSGPNELLWTGGTRLHVIAWFGLQTALQELQRVNDRSLDPNAKDFVKGRTPLHLACTRGHSQVALELLHMGADVSIQDCDGRTALWEAVDMGDVASLSQILERPGPAKSNEQIKKALNDQNAQFESRTPLMLALQRASDGDEIVEMLLRQPQLEANAQDCSGRTAIHIAANAGYVSDVRKLTSLIDLDFSLRDAAGRTPTIAAISSGHFLGGQVIYLMALLESASCHHSFDINAADNDGRTLLHIAATNDDYSPVVKLLATANADVNKRDSHGRTPLHNAAFNLDNDGVAKFLISMQADLSARDEQGMTPFDLAVQQAKCWANAILPENYATQQQGCTIPWNEAIEHPEEFFQKISNIPDEILNQADPVGYTLLHCAVCTRQFEAVQYLLRRSRVNIHAQAQDYLTALHIALNNVRDGFDPTLEMVHLLLAHGADVNVAGEQGRSPLECAFDTQNFRVAFSVAIALIKKGARLALARETLQEILNFAIRNDEPEAMKILLEAGASLFLYRRAGLLPSETAKEEKASERIVEMLEKGENEVLELIAGG